MLQEHFREKKKSISEVWLKQENALFKHKALSSNPIPSSPKQIKTEYCKSKTDKRHKDSSVRKLTQ
jgi:hypothetical protein